MQQKLSAEIDCSSVVEGGGGGGGAGEGGVNKSTCVL